MLRIATADVDPRGKPEDDSGWGSAFPILPPSARPEREMM